MIGSIPKNGTVAEPGLVWTAPGKGVMTIEPVSVCLLTDQLNATHKIVNHSPEGIDNRTLLPSDVVIVPVPGFWVDGFSDTSENTEGTEVVILDVMSTKATEETDGGGSRVEMSEFVFLDSLPVT
jgi:hypothetical protein